MRNCIIVDEGVQRISQGTHQKQLVPNKDADDHHLPRDSPRLTMVSKMNQPAYMKKLLHRGPHQNGPIPSPEADDHHLPRIC